MVRRLQSNSLSELVVVDAIEGPLYDLIYWPTQFSPNSRRVGYIARQGQAYVTVIDGVRVNFPNGAWSVIFSPDSTEVTFVGRRGEREIVIRNGQATFDVSRPDGIGLLAFSPDSRRVAYVVTRGDTQRIAVDGVEGKPYRKIWKSEVPENVLMAYGTASLGLFMSRVDPGFAFDGPTAIRSLAITASEFFRVETRVQTASSGCGTK